MASILNSKDLKKLSQLDPIFHNIYERFGPPPNMKRPSGFTSLCKIILEQQVSLASARAHFERLNAYVSEFTPTQILKLNDIEMRECHISKQKASYLKALSEAILRGTLNLERLSGLREPEVRKQLTKIKGIGDWTADVYLMFCLESKDIFPIGDIALVHTVKELTPANTRDEMILYSQKWKPLRSLASFSLWHYYLKKRNRPLLL